ncbi:MAG: hypothetical protein EAZ97_06635 [Bacteroidetes bacterium]|nr:MAG: hypothetical protein EAZ97_06635 [Bacteroidota bacterium]
MDWSVYGKLAAVTKTGEKYVFSYDAPTLCVEYRRISAVFYAPFIKQIFRFAFSRISAVFYAPFIKQIFRFAFSFLQIFYFFSYFCFSKNNENAV